MANTQHFAPILTPHLFPELSPEQKSYTWTHPSIEPFNEMLVSWNALRPLKGQYVILVSVLHRNWSPWLLYAVWGSHGQYSFHETTPHSPVHTFQDQVELLDDEQATGFRIRIEACEGAALDQFISLFACTTQIGAPKQIFPPPAASIELPVKGLSQLCLTHPRSTSFCSPSSVTSVIHYHVNTSVLNPSDFAREVYDSGFDIYGHWPFNTAQSFVELGPPWQTCCARMAGFDSIINILKEGFPVIVSLKGHLTGSCMPYAAGHLIVVRGYDAPSQSVLCMDPAYPADEQTLTSYPLNEFMQAWGNRSNLAYIIKEIRPRVKHTG